MAEVTKTKRNLELLITTLYEADRSKKNSEP